MNVFECFSVGMMECSVTAQLNYKQKSAENTNNDNLYY